MFKELVQALSTNRIDYLLNDPTTPKLTVSLAVPAENALKFHVVGWEGKQTGAGGSLQAGRCYITVAKGIDYLQATRKQQKAGLIQSWSGVRDLQVNPRAGSDLNAYYNRRALCFFSQVVPGMGAVSAADSADVVAHELGHALLDAQRPDFWNVQALEIWSFHESYADITAVAGLLQFKKVREYVLKETNGDLRKSNVASRLAEQMGEAIYRMANGQGGLYQNCLRDASMRFEYKNPAHLPRNAPHNKLCAECHSFGRIFLGAWYEIMIGFYELNKKTGQNGQLALKNACDAAFSYMVKSLQRAPRVVRFYHAISNHMLSLCATNREHYLVVKRVLTEYKLIKPKIMMMQSKISGSLSQEEEVLYVHVARPKTIKLSDHLAADVVHAFAVDKLADVELEVPNDSYYEFDKQGNLLDEVSSSEAEVVDEARLCAAIIQSTQQVGPDEDTMWEIKNDKLERTFIQ